MATRGLKPVPEIQFFDYIWPAMMQIRDELCDHALAIERQLQMSRGDSRGDRRIFDRRRDLSQPERRIDFHALPGIARGDAVDGAGCGGLLRTAIRCDDPVMFLEHKHLYRQPYNRSEYPGAGLHSSVRKSARGEGRNGRQHRDLWGVCSSRRSGRCATAARRDFGGDSGFAFAVAVRLGRICATVRKTHRVIVAYEDMLSWGYGAELAARIADELFDELDAPVKRIAAMDTFCAYQPKLEDAILPQSDAVVASGEEVAGLLRADELRC